MTPRFDRLAAAAALARRQPKCFPCGATCRPVSVGLFTHPSMRGRHAVYGLCRTCASDYADPKQRQAFAEAVHRRFIKLGEVTA